MVKKKRNKKYRERPVRSNTIDWAISGVYTLRHEDRTAMMEPMKIALMQFKRATAEQGHWNALAEGMNIGEALAALDIGANLLPRIHKAQAALERIAMRMMSTEGSACKAPELAAITEAIVCCSAQLQLCTQAELQRARERINNMERSGVMDDMKQIFQALIDQRDGLMCE